jgi:hypothetical protein
MMARLTTFVDDETEKQIKKQASDEGISISECTASLIKLGLRIKSMQQDESKQKMDELMQKTPEYLLRLIAISSEIFRATYDPEKCSRKDSDPNDLLLDIKSSVQSYIKGYTQDDEV